MHAPVKIPPRNPALDAIPKNLMVELDEKKAALRRAGRALHDFGLGDPREPTPPFLREALRAAIPEVSQYPSPMGTPALRAAAAGYLERRFGVSVDPDRQIVPATGAKESIFHLPLAFAGEAGGRRKVVIPDPGYPTYEAGTRLAGLTPVKVPLRAENGFLLEPGDLPASLLDETLLFWLSYPHNPTGAVAPRGYLERVGRAALDHGFVVASDECYADIYFEEPPRSMLEVQVENVLAIHSCSKRSGMTGYRTGFVAGDADLISQVKRMRSHPGVASPDFVSAAAVAAWNDDAHVAERREVFRAKRDRLARFFREHGLSAQGSCATLYLWVKVPDGFTSASYASRLLDEAIVVSPGTAFGAAGEGYVRVSLVPTLQDIEEAIERWRTVR
jgi:acetylornithine/N-succinyldiaminopimelate aminotransferase